MDKTATLKLHYGMQELRALSARYSGFALTLAVLIHLSVIGGYYLAEYLAQEDEPVYTMRIMKYTELGPPPSIMHTESAPQLAIMSSTAKPTIGVPVPVPDAEVSPEHTFATQQEMSQQMNPVSLEGFGGDGGVKIEQDIRIEDDGPPPDFVPVEKQPVVVKEVKPVYPDLAQRANMEGTVWVKIWVDKEGKPRKAVVIKSDAEIFNEVAVNAAMQWVFTPAIMNDGPVAVWVAIPFKFKLKN
ncbi:MAG: energy transducer TonB [Bacteroidetes bacterium]|nr:energy transducer TonB [Bacteroidota bacterium]MBU1422731.1 energy transducer TonB [Bacteroidota bacterium]MBU2471663.1 energy transducer TonB [Bacteroidota bacterium]MBU2635489.1 energy transducer TonB [Bacteroidota bacterium]